VVLKYVRISVSLIDNINTTYTLELQGFFHK
jgi:hypothetical protein